jgi:hypothetical protein
MHQPPYSQLISSKDDVLVDLHLGVSFMSATFYDVDESCTKAKVVVKIKTGAS